MLPTFPRLLMIVPPRLVSCHFTSLCGFNQHSPDAETALNRTYSVSHLKNFTETLNDSLKAMKKSFNELMTSDKTQVEESASARVEELNEALEKVAELEKELEEARKNDGDDMAAIVAEKDALLEALASKEEKVGLFSSAVCA